MPCLSQLDKFGLHCASQSKTLVPAMVAEVSSGSPAYRSGLKYGDGIVAVQTKEEGYALTVDRQGKRYSVTLRGGINQRQIPVVEIGRDQLPFPELEIARVGHDGVIQHAYQNCWFEASLSAVADSREGPMKIANMITPGPAGYVVKFPGVPGIYQISDSQIDSAGIVDPAKWAAVLEAAETQIYPDNSPARGATTGNPGVKVGLEMLTGKKIAFVRPEALASSQLSDLLTRLKSQGQPITVASKSRGEHKQSFQPVTPNHAYSVVDFDGRSGLITLRNPYGREAYRGSGLIDNISPDEIRLDLPTFSTFFRFVAYPE
jgi:hypothetical protein